MLAAWENSTWPVVRSSTYALVCCPVLAESLMEGALEAALGGEVRLRPGPSSCAGEQSRYAPRVAKNTRIGGYNRRRGSK